MDRNELKALLKEIMEEEQCQAQPEQPKSQMNPQAIMNQVGQVPVIGQAVGATGAVLGGSLSIIGSLFEGVSHVIDTASKEIGNVGNQLKK